MKVDGRERGPVWWWDRYCAFGDYLYVVADVKEHFMAVFWPFKSGLVNSRGNRLYDKLKHFYSVRQMERLSWIPDGAEIVRASPAWADVPEKGDWGFVKVSDPSVTGLLN